MEAGSLEVGATTALHQVFPVPPLTQVEVDLIFVQATSGLRV